MSDVLELPPILGWFWLGIIAYALWLTVRALVRMSNWDAGSDARMRAAIGVMRPERATPEGEGDAGGPPIRPLRCEAYAYDDPRPPVRVTTTRHDLVPPLEGEHGVACRRMPDDAAAVLVSAVERLRTSREGRSLEPFATPTVVQQLAAIVKSVRAFAEKTSPETADGPLATEVLCARATGKDTAEARVVICTPPTQESGRRATVVREDQIWRVERQSPAACHSCGAPVSGPARTCEFCGGDVGDGPWRIVNVTPTRWAMNPLGRTSPVLTNYLRWIDGVPTDSDRAMAASPCSWPGQASS